MIPSAYCNQQKFKKLINSQNIKASTVKSVSLELVAKSEEDPLKLIMYVEHQCFNLCNSQHYLEEDNLKAEQSELVAIGIIFKNTS